MPTIDELLNKLGRASWFLKLDLRQGFHQIRMAKEDIPKTTFQTHQGHYKMKVMSFGLCNASFTFQVTMNELLKSFLHKFVVVFFYDILVYSPCLSSHMCHLEAMVITLSQGEFYLHHSKCLFARNQFHYLGHIVSDQGVALDPDKIQAMLDWPHPSSPTELRRFLGLTGFYHKFVRGYASIAGLLTTLLRKDQFLWNSDVELAFTQLKQLMNEAPVLATPDFAIPFVLETDTFGSAIRVVLIQSSHLIAFYSKLFCPCL